MVVAGDMGTRKARNVLFNRYVNPVMLEFGFLRDRRIYRRFNGLGDCVLVEFQISQGIGGDAYCFYVVLTVVPRPWMEWYAAQGLPVDFDRPTQAHGMEERLDVPNPVASTRPDLWVVDTVESAHIVGVELAVALRPWLRELVGILDREVFVERLRERDDYPFGSRSGRDSVLAMFLSDRGMSDELEAILNKDEEEFRTRAVATDEEELATAAGSPFAKWIRERAARAT
ncbi:hypothetical protein [Virgisporangium aurantiacum]|uniref:Uncharacterized protein n=1 Tax=Virgisporangium aurantiacum TaxID=175570 RepID=A0A8J3Z8G0_9ACTN|nr:hypothetical protein [Virgisporangium aurantiacum]GIJ57225.1 hypothetical protein Vau01_047410 [Virgisporangium aurantiacum]